MDDWQKKYILNRMNGNVPGLPGEREHIGPRKVQRNPGNDDYVTPMNNINLPTKPSNTCSIRPGALLYRAVDTQGFGSTSVFVVPVGQAPEDFSTRQFEYKENVSSCYLLENQMAPIDMGKLQEKTTLSLVEVSSPFIGKFFVQQSNVMYNLQYSKDNRASILKG